MRDLFYTKDKVRGKERTFLKLVEEVGELSEAILLNDEHKITEEIIDVIAWIFSIANLVEIDIDEVFFQKYNNSCPRCKNNPCTCDSI